MRTAFIFLTLLIACHLNAKSPRNINDDCLKIHQQWLDMSLKLTKNCVGFSAPVAARSLAYLSIGQYESVVELLPENKSLSNQLAGYKRTTWISPKQEISFPHVVNSLNYKMITYLYANMPPAELKKVDEFFLKITKSIKKGTQKNIIKNSILYADLLSNELIEFSKRDHGDQGYSRNFPLTYTPPICQGCWLPTYPGYKRALLPYWGENEMLVFSNQALCENIPVLRFSTDHNSEFYKEAEKVSELYKNFNENQEIIAEYWDDSPGISGTPVGHFFQLTLNLCQLKNVELKNYVQLNVHLGIAINDALIQVWKLKYLHNLIRPISYIQQYIRKDFNTNLETPPFPEFPSGHSFQAGAATEVLKFYFSDTMNFQDKTNIGRSDINGNSREYESFSALANEMSISRFFGGIHFKKTLEISLEYGAKIGFNTLKSIQFNK